MHGAQQPGTRGLLAGRIVFVATIVLGAPLLAGVWNWLGSGALSIDGWQMGAVPNLLVGCLALAFEEWLWRRRWWWPASGTLFLFRSVGLHLVYVALAFRLSITMGHLYGAYLMHGWAPGPLATALAHSLRPVLRTFPFTVLLTAPAGVVVGVINGYVLRSRGERAPVRGVRPTTVPAAAPAAHRSTPGRFPRFVLWALGGGGGAVVLWSLATAGLVVWRAETLAHGQPYCIQVASPSDGSTYEAATRLWDLTGWRMRAYRRGGEGSASFLFHHHALLVVDSGTLAFRNWSYWKQNFVDEVMERHLKRDPPVQCVPEPHFGRRLPFVVADRDRKYVLRLANQTYAVPQAYRPRLQTDILRNPRLVLTAVAPAFAPFEAGRPRWQSLLYYDVVLRPEANHSVDTVWTQWTDQRAVEDAGEDSGLRKAVIVFADKTAPAGKRPATSLYYAKTDGGRLTTLIRCEVSFTPDRCWHHFARDGLVVSFYHPRDRLADWAAMQARLAGLLASFVPKTATSRPTPGPATATGANAPDACWAELHGSRDARSTRPQRPEDGSRCSQPRTSAVRTGISCPTLPARCPFVSLYGRNSNTPFVTEIGGDHEYA